MYTDTRDAVIEPHDWSFAIKFYSLAALASPPLGEFTNAFNLPPEVLRVSELQELGMPWKIEGRTIRTDATRITKAKCIVRVEDPAIFPPTFISALAYRLASELALPITNSVEVSQTMFQLYEQRVREAVSSSNRQGTSRQVTAKWIQKARWSSPSFVGPYV